MKSMNTATKAMMTAAKALTAAAKTMSSAKPARLARPPDSAPDYGRRATTSDADARAGGDQVLARVPARRPADVVPQSATRSVHGHVARSSAAAKPDISAVG